MPSGPRLAAVRPHLHGDPCPSGSEPLILTYNFGILHILSQNARFMLNLTGQLGWPTLYMDEQQEILSPEYFEKNFEEKKYLKILLCF